MARQRARQKDSKSKKASKASGRTYPSPAPREHEVSGLKMNRIAHGRSLQKETLLLIQRQNGNQAVQSIVQRQPEHSGQGGQSPGELLAQIFTSSPAGLALICQEHLNSIATQVAELERAGVTAGDYYFDQLSDVSTRFFVLKIQLIQVHSQTSTEEQRNRVQNLATRHQRIITALENRNLQRVAQDLRRTRQRTEQIRLHILDLYREVYTSGRNDTTALAVSEAGQQTTTLRELGGHVTNLLTAINDADAQIAMRQVANIVPILNHVMSFANLILGWNFTSPLASQVTEDLNFLRNGLSVATTVASELGLGRFLPFFSHIGLLLGGIANNWAIIERGLRHENSQWWELRDVLGDDTLNLDVEPGGRPVFTYMRQVFAGESPAPDDNVVAFFNARRDMFNIVATRLMGNFEIPTTRWFLFWHRVDPAGLTAWVYNNRQWIWRLIYGNRSTPEER